MYRTVFTPPTWTGGVGFNPLLFFVFNAVLTGHLVTLTREPSQRTNQTPIIIVFLNTKVRGLNPTPSVQVGSVNPVLDVVRWVVISEELELLSVTLTCFLD